MHIFQQAMLSGIQFPEQEGLELEGIRKNQNEIQQRITALESEKADIRLKVDQLREDFRAANLEDSGGLAKIERDIEAFERKLAFKQEQVTQLTDHLQSFDDKIKGLMGRIETYLRGELTKGRQEMQRQLDTVTFERGRQLGTSTDGYLHTSPPEAQSPSRIAVCEVCRQNIGLFDPVKICQPVTATDFANLHGGDQPFPPGAYILDFHCPGCGNRPWAERDKILTNMGFFAVPNVSTDCQPVNGNSNDE